MRASGKVLYGGKLYEFSPETDFGALDWGRGVWTYDNVWYWGSGSGDIDGHRFGFNIGYGFGDTSAASENVIFMTVWHIKLMMLSLISVIILLMRGLLHRQTADLK